MNPVQSSQSWFGQWGCIGRAYTPTPTFKNPCLVRTIYPWTRREKADGQSTHPQAHWQVVLK